MQARYLLLCSDCSEEGWSKASGKPPRIAGAQSITSLRSRGERGSTAKQENGEGRWRPSPEFWRRNKYGLAAEFSGRAPVVASDGTGFEGTRRRTRQLPRDGSRGKDEARDTPQGRTSCRALGAGEPRSCKGSRVVCPLGVCRRRRVAGFSFRTSYAPQIPRCCRGGDSEALSRQ